MPIHDIQTKEYECSRCHWKWINRRNGKDGPIPSKCAKCKKPNWNKGEEEAISPEDNGLRRRIRGFRRGHYAIGGLPEDLIDKFLNIEPRATHLELLKVMNPLDLPSWYNTREHRGHILGPPGPDKAPNWLMHSPGKYYKLLEQEHAKRLEVMMEIVKSRGIEYNDPMPATTTTATAEPVS